MAETKTTKLTEYTIPLRKFWLNRPTYDRTSRVISTIKTYLSKHCKIDASNIKIDTYFNNSIWMRGRRSPPSKITVKVAREGDKLNVTFAEEPESVKFSRAKHGRLNTPAAEVKAETPSKDKQEESKEQVEKVHVEKEKEQAVAELNQKEAKKEAKESKRIPKSEKSERPQRKDVLN